MPIELRAIDEAVEDAESERRSMAGGPRGTGEGDGGEVGWRESGKVGREMTEGASRVGWGWKNAGHHPSLVSAISAMICDPEA